MIVYLDTSHLVKLYCKEPDSDQVQQLVNDADGVATSVLAYAEARATIARRRRERLITAGESGIAIKQLDADWSRFIVLTCDGHLAVEAGRLADVHGVRGADAVHLASFAALLGRSPDDVHFSCADDRLLQAARSLG
jgi:predicted nucleic acid-binding protein